MRGFVILDKQAGRNNYRGIDRPRPSYVVGKDDKAEINQLFFWSTNIHKTDDEYLKDIVKGKRLVQLYSELPNPIEYELVEVTLQNESHQLGAELIGFDIVVKITSLLSYGMSYCVPKEDRIDGDHLMCLIEKYFRPQLNDSFLFKDYATAEECLHCMKALFHLVDYNPWEMQHLNYRVAGLYRIVL